MSDIFLSYAREDLPRVKPLEDALQQRGWSVWWDGTIKPGQIFHRVIEAALKKAKCVVVLWSETSILSEWVLDEAHEACDQETLIPARLDRISMPLGFRSRHAADLIEWQRVLPHSGFEELASAVEEMLAISAARPVKTLAATAPSAPPRAALLLQPDGLYRCTRADTDLFVQMSLDVIGRDWRSTLCTTFSAFQTEEAKQAGFFWEVRLEKIDVP